VFMRKDEAHEVLKVHKRANYFLEEIRPGNLERECNEEKCSFEEAKEIFHSQEKTMEFWFNYKGLNPCSTNPCSNGGVCKIRYYNYFCICPPKFGGENCEKEKFECWYKNGGCWQYCRDGSSAFRVVCSCAKGYTLHEDGKRCVQAATSQFVQVNVSSALEHNDSRITGGTLCHRGHCPWQVLIRNSKDTGFCGGSLISSRWVVTAAHCLDLVRPHHVTIGDFDKYQREFKEQKIDVERSWTHPHYDSNDYNGDIALLYLSSDVIFNEYAIPICLPSPNLATLLSEEGRIGMVSGWGATHDRGSTLRFLMKVRLPIVNMETCQRSTDRLITDNMFCAGYNTEVADACKGDSGGPFTVPYHNTWFLLGIVSWGEGCAEKGKYGVYTRVSNYIPWIKEIVE
ncbi:FAXD protein, partial [Sagittarius serpentarius]|nr:FAXD protein [Sagittarius serpentarius]